MKVYTGLISLVAASFIMTGCSDSYKLDTANANVNSDTGKYSVTGLVKGCVYEDLDSTLYAASGFKTIGFAFNSGNPVVGADVTIGAVTGKTDSDGCYALNVNYNTTTTDETNYSGKVVVEYPGFQKNTQTFETEHILAGVMFDFGFYGLDRDTTAPHDRGMVGITYVDGMLSDGIDGITKPFQLLLSEEVQLSSTISENTVIEVYDADATELDLGITATVTFDSNTNVLSVKTSEAIDEGLYVRILIPQDAVTDFASNIVVSGTDDTNVGAEGDALTDYLTFGAVVFKESSLMAGAVASVTQMDEDDVVDDGDADLMYSYALRDLAIANPTFKNAVKHDEYSVSGGLISNFNNDESDRVEDLANAYFGSGVSVFSDVLRFKFTPTNANYYIIKAYSEDGDAVSFDYLADSANAEVNNVDDDFSVKLRATYMSDMLRADSTADIEVALGLNISGVASQEYSIKITPYSIDGVAGTAIVKTVKDNVLPTASLQYSYDTSDGVVVSVSGGVQPVTEEIYGGSGEISNSTEAQADDNTTYSFGLPILDMTYNLLADKNATLDNGNTDLPADYNASEYTAWKALNGTARSFGVGFTEQVTNVTDASSEVVLTNVEVNSTTINSIYNNAGNEELVIVTVADIFAMVNDENGSKITLNVTDLAGNTATSSVLLNDKVQPFIVSADLNVSKTITFSENIKDANTTINITGLGNVNVSDVNITTNTITLDNNESVLGLTRPYSIRFDGTDLNGNSATRTFRVD